MGARATRIGIGICAIWTRRAIAPNLGPETCSSAPASFRELRPGIFRYAGIVSLVALIAIWTRFARRTGLFFPSDRALFDVAIGRGHIGAGHGNDGQEKQRGEQSNANNAHDGPPRRRSGGVQRI